GSDVCSSDLSGWDGSNGRIATNAVNGSPTASYDTRAAYPVITPRCSSRRTRWWTADTDSPTRSARSVYDNRPSSARAATIARSISSTNVNLPCRVAATWHVIGAVEVDRPPERKGTPMLYAMLICGDEAKWF